ncbi:MAG: ribulose-phosphate 3-epimerase [Staphylococcus equorum]|uniref:ribulose-phosphate 3-epimerase n=1 Tax=Staphylococcus TaxID=1279 RepID=UPI000267D961|nr:MULTISPECIES: ribulose-phosphate 3-epimerase [Staphylococcus]ALM56818.1 ribulose-phosphate 3-epimerase [Staphylococcus equorum]EJX17644.1 ribulose-phosphate 3-epimerase [Staphylococcus sp. OJ82]MDK9842291.1 ribulose-phosphate 3-epimerase [Staphylococcus equorum]MDK9851044.1 ribulose-phosphate 3-epimerase [Staphylococcus equorum]MDK9859960.1 ribulose-phosphate 3-epimerase [Staphylococcus equorum]
MAKLYPSLLSTDFLKLQEELTALEEAGVDGVHFDVMDGQFVPNISIGLPILEAVRKGTRLPIDVHLMIEKPEKYVELFADYGADMISVHVEATPHIHRVIEQIKNKNVKAGVVINPGTPVDAILPVIKMVDFVLVMTVNPGFGGQSFISDTVVKLDQLSKIKDELNLEFEIEVDGGINNETVETVINHGATMLVAGSYFFKHDDYKEVTKTLKG